MRIALRVVVAIRMVTIVMVGGIATAANADSTQVSVKDSWWGQDKVTHAVVGFTIAGFATGIARNMLNNPDKGSVAIGVSIPLGLGAIKEWYDLKHSKRHQASLKDLVAGAVGAALGAAFIIGFSS